MGFPVFQLVKELETMHKVIRTYTHHDGRVGVIAEFKCGSDFTSRTQEFREYMDKTLMAICFHQDEGIQSLQMVHDNLSYVDYEQQMTRLFREPVGLLRAQKFTTEG
jgi:translation elongation factor EF-Ts